jgi:hypothetical protein
MTSAPGPLDSTRDGRRPGAAAGRRRRAAAGLLACALAACAGPRPTRITYPPDELTATPLDRELATKNDAELWAIGEAAEAAADSPRAAAAFGRLADLFPASPHATGARLRAGAALQRTGDFAGALERFRAAAAAGGAGALEGAFGEAESLYHLGDLAGARAVLDALAARPGLGAPERLRALVQRGVVELELGAPLDAERTLEGALALARDAGERERLDPAHAAQAEFHLGELRREAFRAVRLDPAGADDEALARDLERKADLLLAAQERYLATLRAGDARWAIAAGLRIGELYEELRAELLAAPLPPGLDAEGAALYRAELAARVRVLAAKAIGAWEETLALAARSGQRDLRAVPEAAAALERLKALVAEE